ncbi:integrin beta-1-A-like isoform X2 [Ptychodera flava]|uniref:integrin beta-1-A-like isoform X2 n=1 Tax=Ptychodera flava TaxID=63121 RepID=UPI003969C7E0
MARHHLIVVLVLAIYQYSVLVQSQSTKCPDAKTCGDCIVTHPSCGWCDDWEYHHETSYPQCDDVNTLLSRGCASDKIVDPISSVNITQAEPLSDAGSDVGKAVQIKPQEITVKLRPGKPGNIKVSVRQAEDYPVDLYYVMDVSNSMADDLEKLKVLGEVLAEEMKNITKNFRLGFGSFVDKTVMPYINTLPEVREKPCDGCVPPYGFINALPLDTDSTRFSDEIQKQKTSGNLDSPEGGMDALMQATVCHQQIGWRESARHLIIYTTDAAFHYAGDGKLGGIVRPNDGECYLNTSTGEYYKSTELDYPSISQLNYQMQKHNVIPVFAVTGDNIKIYEELTNFIEGSTAGELASDSSNIVDLVKENYNKITSKVLMVDDAPENITVSYTSICLNNVTEKGSKECSGLRVGDTVYFDIEITANGCPKPEQQKFTIKPVGFNEELVVNVELECNCGCEDDQIPAADECSNGNGTLVCAGCVCNENRYGRKCECSSEDNDFEENDEPCKQTNTSLVCTGRGNCVCGECACNPGRSGQVFSGKFCECDNMSCDRSGGEVCGGPERGECVCDKDLQKSVCQCFQGWIGSACECPDNNDACIASNGLECNGLGYCDCGECKCNSSITLYTGKTCEDCPIGKDYKGLCEVNKCRHSKACVQCKAFKSGNLSKTECDECPYPVQTVKDLEKGEGIEVCRFQDDDDCIFEFIQGQLENGTYILYVDEDKVCPVAVNPLFIVLGVVLGILFIGLALLLIWKLLTTIHDRREFAKFEKERQNAKWDAGENPIYKQATSTFKNPTYKGAAL